MSSRGHECYIISNDSEDYDWGDVKFLPLRIKWGKVSIIEALRTIRALYSIFRKERFDVVQYATTNAALYASIAAWLARVQVRIYCQWGISYFERKGLDRFIYESAEIITCKCSTSVQPDSYSNLDFSYAAGLYNSKKGCVIHNGSACGVDCLKFDIKQKDHWRSEILQTFGLEKYTAIFGFVGRIVRDKGINELLTAFLEMNRKDVALLMVGPIDSIQLDAELLSKAYESPNIIWTGPVNDTERYFSTLSFYVLPSYHEGFGMTVLEAAAMGVPSIITNIKGPTDLIIDNDNGFVCEVKSTASLKAALEKALSLDKESYNRLSENAYNKAYSRYNAEDFREEFYNNRLYLYNHRKK